MKGCEKKVFYYKKNKKYAEIMPHTNKWNSYD